MYQVPEVNWFIDEDGSKYPRVVAFEVEDIETDEYADDNAYADDDEDEDEDADTAA